jgi:curved DNA-binding protein CbpA
VFAAEANEVLSNAESRAVYDSMRHSYEMFKSRENYGRQQHSNYGDSGMGHDFYDTDDFDYFDGQSHDYYTGLRPDVNLFIPAGQVQCA